MILLVISVFTEKMQAIPLHNGVGKGKGYGETVFGRSFKGD